MRKKTRKSIKNRMEKNQKKISLKNIAGVIGALLVLSAVGSIFGGGSSTAETAAVQNARSIETSDTSGETSSEVTEASTKAETGKSKYSKETFAETKENEEKQAKKKATTETSKQATDVIKQTAEQQKAEAAALAAAQQEAEAQARAQQEAGAIAQSAGGGGNAENFNTYNIPEQQNTTATYVLNTSTGKFHYPHCNDVKKISPENYGTISESRDNVIAMGYSPCGHCKP